MFEFQPLKNQFVVSAKTIDELLCTYAYIRDWKYYNDNYAALIEKNREQKDKEKSQKRKVKLNKDYCQIIKKAKEKITLIRKKISEDKITVVFNIQFSDAKNGIEKTYFDKKFPSVDHILCKIDFNLEMQQIDLNRLTYLYEVNNYYECNNELTLSSTFNIGHDFLIFDNLFIEHNNRRRKFTINFSDKTNKKTLDKALNFLAYFQAKPTFIYSKNPYYNEKIDSLYDLFDLTDLLFITDKKFFNRSDQVLNDSIIPPKFACNYSLDYETISSNIIQHPTLFQLYHDSLKQIEPLPRCVFLYRIFEYATTSKKNFYSEPFEKFLKEKGVEDEKEKKKENLLQFFYKKALEHKFIKLYYLDHGFKLNSKYDGSKKNQYISVRQESYQDLISKLKKKSIKILSEWKNEKSNNPFYDNIFMAGRNAVAHGNFDELPIKTYEKIKDYQHINNVNVFLELISRYIIETMNPGLNNIVIDQKPKPKKNVPNVINISS